MKSKTSAEESRNINNYPFNYNFRNNIETHRNWEKRWKINLSPLISSKGSSLSKFNGTCLYETPKKTELNLQSFSEILNPYFQELVSG